MENEPRAGASLPDRVEAAAKAAFEYDIAHGNGPDEIVWLHNPDAVRYRYRESITAALAAADACEAERNPNTTDVKPLIEPLSEDALAKILADLWSDWHPVTEGHAGYPWVFFANRLTRDFAMFARMPVSSEDVHREADPHDVFRRALQETGAGDATKEAAERVIAERANWRGDVHREERT